MSKSILNRSTAIAGMLAVPVLVLAESGGAPQGSSGAPGEETCAACHGPATGTGRLRIELAESANTYVPGQRVRAKVTVEDPNATRWGFQLTARTEANPRAAAGTLATVDIRTRVLRSGVLEWITHSMEGTQRGTRGQASFDFDWTPPATDAGAVILYAAANAANNDGRNTGDRAYVNNMKLTAAAAGGVRPSFTSTSVVETYSSQPGLAPGAWVSITGTDLASQERYASPAAGAPLETTLGGVRVKINDTAAALQFVSPTRITLLVPASVPAGDVPVVIERDAAASDPVMVRSNAVLPAIHSVRESGSDKVYASVSPAGTGLGLSLVVSRGWLLGKPEADARVTRGVFPGEEIDIWAIGLGKTEGDFVTDRPFSGSFAVSSPVRVRFGDLGVDSSTAALVSPGLYMVRVKTPESLAAGEVPLLLEIAGATSSDKVLLNIQARPQ